MDKTMRLVELNTYKESGRLQIIATVCNRGKRRCYTPGKSGVAALQRLADSAQVTVLLEMTEDDGIEITLWMRHRAEPRTEEDARIDELVAGYEARITEYEAEVEQNEAYL